MKRIEGVILFSGARNGYAFLCMLTFWIVMLIIGLVNQRYFVDHAYYNENIVMAFILTVIVGSFIVYLIGYFAYYRKSLKNVSVEIDTKNQFVSLFVDGKKKFKSRNFKFSGEFVLRAGRYHSEIFFCLSIQDHNLMMYKYYEPLSEKKEINGVVVSPKAMPIAFPPTNSKSCPDFIWDVFQALKNYREATKNILPEDEKPFSPFESTSTPATVKSYSYEEEKNLSRWNETAEINSKSDFYNLEEFKNNPDYLALDEIEKSAFPELKGKSLLHLQCHFGMSTLSFARMGANVTGVDFSDNAIDTALLLANELAIPAGFVCSNIYDLRENLEGKFDYIFTSYGVKAWLKDIPEWARIIAHFLKPGGTFFIAEFHPFAGIFDDETEEGLKVRYPYFPDGKPMRYDNDYSYADSTKLKNTETYEWTHSLEEILNSLLKAGLKIQEYKEYAHSVYQMFPFMKCVKRGEYRIEGDPIPLMFSVKVTK